MQSHDTSIRTADFIVSETKATQRALLWNALQSLKFRENGLNLVTSLLWSVSLYS